MAGKQYLEPEAFKLYKKNRTQKEIAEALGVSEQTISAWSNKYEWEKRRRAWNNSTQAISEKLMELLADDVQKMDKLDNGVVDRINKAVLSITKLDQNVDMLASTIQIMEDFVAYLQARNNPLYTNIQDVLPDFLAFQGQKYNKR